MSLKEEGLERDSTKRDGVELNFLSNMGDEVIFNRWGGGEAGGLRWVESLGAGVTVGLRRR